MLSVEIYKFKTKEPGINAAPLSLGNDLKDFSFDNMKRTGLYGYVYDFSVDYDSSDANDITDIHKYLIKKYGIK